MAAGPQALPQELARHVRPRERLDRAWAERRKGSRTGRRIQAPMEEPAGKPQINLTDADSGLTPPQAARIPSGVQRLVGGGCRRQPVGAGCAREHERE